jgi:hypothetical protein
MSTDVVLPIWVVYDHPRDYPHHYVVRLQWACANGTIRAEPYGYLFVTLADARVWLEHQGLTRLQRFPDDDPVIMETWI